MDTHVQNLTSANFRRVAANPRQRTAAENRKRRESGESEIPFDADECHLLDLWNKQDGCCNICGIEMDLIGQPHRQSIANPLRVSVDCIDPNQWYIRGNLALTHHVCNSFKNQLNSHEVYAIAKGIVKRSSEMHPKIDVEIADELVSRDGVKFYHYPKYSYKSSGEVTLSAAAKAHLEGVLADRGDESDAPPEEGG